jgi:hypothetical protein
MIRHMVASGNVDQEGYVIDPSQAVHGVILHGLVKEFSGSVDPVTHLNRDFPDHHLGPCVIAMRLEPGSPVLVDSEGQLTFAQARPSAFKRSGRVDVGARRLEWLQVHRERRQEDKRC